LISERPRKALTWKKGLITLAVSWVVCGISIYTLQLMLWPKEELECRTNLRLLAGAVAEYNQAHPSAPLTEDIPDSMVQSLGIKTHDASGKEVHYYFLSPSPHGGVMPKCNAHDINPLSLELMGVTIVAVIGSVLFLSLSGYTLVLDPPQPDGTV